MFLNVIPTLRYIHLTHNLQAFYLRFTTSTPPNLCCNNILSLGDLYLCVCTSHRKQFQVYFAAGQDELITLEDTKVIPKMRKLFRIITLYTTKERPSLKYIVAANSGTSAKLMVNGHAFRASATVQCVMIINLIFKIQ